MANQPYFSMEAVTTFFSGLSMPSFFDLMKPDPVYSGCPVFAPEDTTNSSLFGCNSFIECSPKFTESTYVHNEYLIYNKFERTLMYKANELAVLTYEGEWFNGKIYEPEINHNSHGIELLEMNRFRNTKETDEKLRHSNGFTGMLRFNTSTNSVESCKN